MKQAIEANDIRKGDLIRWEGDNETAHEYRASGDKSRYSFNGQHYLIEERPESKPPIDRHTLGIVKMSNLPDRHVALVGVRKHYAPHDYSTSSYIEGNHIVIFEGNSWESQHRVEEFIPATAVPIEALDKLREDRTRPHALATFLAAVERVKS